MKFRRIDVAFAALAIIFLIVTVISSVSNQILFGMGEKDIADMPSEIAFRAASWCYFPVYIVSAIVVCVRPRDGNLEFQRFTKTLIHCFVPKGVPKNMLISMIIFTIILDCVLITVCNISAGSCHMVSLPSLFLILHALCAYLLSKSRRSTSSISSSSAI